MPAKVAPVIHSTITTWPCRSFDLAANGRELCVAVVETAFVIGERASGRLGFVLGRTRGP